MPTCAAPVPEVGHGSKPKPINSLSNGARAWLRASEANPKMAFDILICN